MEEELWKIIPEFPNYMISSFGRIWNIKEQIFMSTSYTGFGHLKITLNSERGVRWTRSVAQLVAEAFIPRDSIMYDQVVVLDGDFTNITLSNLCWRPRWFAWKYTRQLKILQPMHYHNLRVLNLMNGVEYRSIIEAGITEGLLFIDIWESTYRGHSVYPNQSVFKIVQRV